MKFDTTEFIKVVVLRALKYNVLYNEIAVVFKVTLLRSFFLVLNCLVSMNSRCRRVDGVDGSRNFIFYSFLHDRKKEPCRCCGENRVPD